MISLRTLILQAYQWGERYKNEREPWGSAFRQLRAAAIALHRAWQRGQG